MTYTMMFFGRTDAMREMDAFEQAYKNGYAAGMKAAEEKIVRCRECALQSGCKVGQYLGNDGFCSYGERSAV